MALKVHNTLSRELEEFVPLVGNRVSLFVCGPTVYDYSHIGHARTYVAFDFIARYLRYVEIDRNDRLLRTSTSIKHLIEKCAHRSIDLTVKQIEFFFFGVSLF